MNTIAQGFLSEVVPFRDIPFEGIRMDVRELVLYIFTDSLLYWDHIGLLERYV